MVDDLRIYDSALAVERIAELAAGSEATGVTPAAKWTFDDGPSQTPINGDPVASMLSLVGSTQAYQLALLKRPSYVANALNGKSVVRFDGIDDYLSTTAAVLSGEAGTVVFMGQLNAEPDAAQTILAQADTAGDTAYLSLAARISDASEKIQYSQNNGGTADTLSGSTDGIGSGTPYLMVFDTGGTAGAIRAFVNNAAQTLTPTSGDNHGNWFADITGADTTAIGALVRSSAASFGALDLAELVAYNRVLSAGELARLYRYAKAFYGVA